ncbi:hypothetical protein HMPREF0762_00227 [Slackia exigua ATCC 700122]|uniref:Uncharacterized protein n=1 Tax=Slackia exigua (strain ATCC 700122 / DSM 15923 / CIP 105133 / JCM 11022 / KCTC 5966 / S-7) TaxID=649764 RepID=D0WEJ7_SLAES|nr:hypothetical protein HMPREF0762_00227 [Slackia exigua ATCC 700122]
MIRHDAPACPHIRKTDTLRLNRASGVRAFLRSSGSLGAVRNSSVRFQSTQ